MNPLWAALFFAGGYYFAKKNRRRNPIPRRRKRTRVQSLLFRRDAGWTPKKALQWARSHGYRANKVHVTEHMIRVRQLPPGEFGTFRTVTFGRGVEAVVAR